MSRTRARLQRPIVAEVLSASATGVPAPRAILAASVALVREAEEHQRLDALAESIARIASELVGADQATLGLVRGDEVVTIAALYPRRLPVGSRFPVGFGVAGWVAATGRAAEIGDVREDRRYVPLPYPEVRSFLGLPLRAGPSASDLVAVLSLAAWRPDAFAPGSAEALAPLAEHAAQLIRRSERWATLTGRVAELEEQVAGPLSEALHELKAPLNALTGFVDLVAEGHAGPLNERQREFLRTGLGEARRLGEGLAALVEAGAAERRQHARVPVAPRSLLEAAATHARGLAAERCLQVEMHASRGLLPVAVDRAAIIQVLTNLIQNGLRATSGGSKITLSATRSSISTSPAVLFSVEDEGPGLPPGRTDQLFDRFQQDSQATRTRRPGNVGLGLWLSRRIVEAHGGEIWGENRQGASGETTGARLCFTLPVLAAEGIKPS